MEVSGGGAGSGHAHATPRSGSKARLDNLFVVHAIISVVLGALAIVFPHFVEFFLVSHQGETLSLVDHQGGDAQKIAHLVLRLYGVCECVFAEQGARVRVYS